MEDILKTFWEIVLHLYSYIIEHVKTGVLEKNSFEFFWKTHKKHLYRSFILLKFQNYNL